MPQRSTALRARIPPSVSKWGIVPELGIAVAAVAATAAVHSVILLRLGESPLFLFITTAAALTFWRGLGPGMLASTLGSAVGSALYAVPLHHLDQHSDSAPFEMMLMFAGSMFTCWLIYRLRVGQEHTEAYDARHREALGFVSHELRQPLSNITLAADLLERDPSDDTRVHVATLIGRSADRLGMLVDELSDLARVQGGGLQLDANPIVLQRVVADALAAARPAAEHRHQHLDVDVRFDPPLWVIGDAHRLEQAFTNLLSNASKYSPEHAVISVAVAAQDHRAVATVRDTGVGIRRDMLDAIFEPFVRESNHGPAGLGLGLTLARNIVVQHGGRLTADSDGPGRGSTFRVELPLS